MRLIEISRVDHLAKLVYSLQGVKRAGGKPTPLEFPFEVGVFTAFREGDYCSLSVALLLEERAKDNKELFVRLSEK